MSDAVRQQLLTLAGRDTSLHLRHRIYIDIVGGGVPFLAQRPLWHPLTEVSAPLGHFDVYVFDVVDVIVSKLKRFSATDQHDIAAMIDYCPAAGVRCRVMRMAGTRLRPPDLDRSTDLDSGLGRQPVGLASDPSPARQRRLIARPPHTAA